MSTALDKAMKAASKLKLDELKRLDTWLHSLIAELESEELEPPEKPGREVVRREHIGAVVYQLEKVRCGKPSCRSCPHGPYWYGYQRKGGRVVSFYVGKDLSKASHQ